jgi:rhodanese-related sulfurtransferase
MKTLWQIPAIALIAVILALTYNQLQTNSLPLVCDLKQPPGNEKPDNISIISIDKAAALFKTDNAFFLDARPADMYAKGHIKGALNLPWKNVEEQCFEVIDKIPPGKTIITYCDGPTCHLCDFLADFLKELGFDNVRALANGWSVWNQNNLPVEIAEVPAE